MNNDWDNLLQSGLVSVPDAFTGRVMREIDRLPRPTPRQTWKIRLQWLAILGTAAMGMAELFSFIFGIWAATTAY
ncbi:MAG: hypothetical protein WAW36_12665 [Methylovulum miyakonense]|uniref:hypothetical protein n=1 Tax=Methylovulum miyakonense TaxID=645578 RepID=UPI003BB6FCFB